MSSHTPYPTQGRSLIFRLNDYPGAGPELVREVLLERGWTEFEDEDSGGDADADTGWNLWWRSSRHRACDYSSLRPWQRLNHYPKSTAITKKDGLARNMRRMKLAFGAAAYNFSPTAHNLPNDYTKFVAEYSKSSDKEKKSMCWICKPADMSRGRGIFLFRELSQLQYDCNAVVQEYITNPFLISGYKFDLRIYVMVPSFQPLQVYIYQEGLVRFSTEKFDMQTLGNMYSHLTNTSINKHGPSYNTNKESIGAGCKWTITQLRHFFAQSGIDDLQLWGKVMNIVILTLIMQSSQVPPVVNCFEMYGFDILIDENLKPWLLEVNFSPALGSDCQTDELVKKPLMNDLIDMLQYNEMDKLQGEIPHHEAMHDVKKAKRSSISRRFKTPGSDISSLRGRPPSHLPDLRGTPSTSGMSTASQLSWPSTFMEEEGDDLDNDYDDDWDNMHVPIVPGCGLPSVQQSTNVVVPNHRRRRSSTTVTTGGAAAAGAPVVDSASSGRSSTSPVPQTRTEIPQAYPRVPAISSKRPLRPTSTKTFLSTSTKPNRLSGLRRSNRTNISTPAGGAGAGKLKGATKVSSTSDSGISSFSGSSGSSELSQDETINQGNHPGEDAHRMNKTNNMNKMNKINELSGGARITSSSSTITAERRTTTAAAGPTTRSSTTTSRRHGSSTHVSLASPAKSALLHPPQTQSRTMIAARKVDGYSKPWRDRGNVAGRGVEGQGLAYRPRELVQRQGDFFLVWPFTESARKCNTSSAAGNIEPRLVIKECQRLLKDRASELRMRASPGVGVGGVSSSSKVPELWAPLNSHSLQAG